MTPKLGSLFDGSGGFPLAGSMCGIEPAWASEVEPYPIAVTRSRFLNMKHLGDISKINGAEVEPVDIITFGSPCQDLSVAGKRAGLKHEANGDDETTRSGLFMEAVRIIKEMRRATNGKYPTFALWENVPGAFSSNKGEDFRIVLEELVKIVEPGAVMPSVPKNGWPYADYYCGDGWSLAYRVFDAQYWGVPQRRRRIHLVLDLRDQRAGKILFEREGLRGHFAESGAPWEAVAGDAESGSGAADCHGFDGYNATLTGDKSSTLGVNCGMSTGRNGVCVPYTLKIRSGCEGGGKGALVQTDMSATPATNNDQYLFQPVGLDFYNMAVTGDVSKTLNAAASDADHVPCVMKPVTLEPGIAAREGGHIYEGVCGTLRANAGDNQMAVAHIVLDDQGGQQINVRTDGKTPTLRAEMHGNVPCVMEASGFCPEQSAKTRGIGYEEEMSPTLRAGVTPGVVVKSWDARGNGDGDTVSTITGDHENRITDYSSVVVEPIAFAQNQRDEVRDLHNVVGALAAEPGMEQQTFVAQPVAQCASEKAVSYATDVGFWSSLKEQSPTLLARGYKDPHLVTFASDNVHYIVRRLTPTECARLQGFPDRWGHPDVKEDFTEEESRFWMDVRNTHATVIGGKEAKEYTKAQMLTWYSKLHTDSAEYKMWGNGIALPPALYCMQGIAEALNGETAVPTADEAEHKALEISPSPRRVSVKRVSALHEAKAAYNRLRKNQHTISAQQKRTIKGQIRAGDVSGAMRGMDKLFLNLCDEE